MRTKFNPQNWLNDKADLQYDTARAIKKTNTKADEVEAVLDQIEKLQLDITSTYESWINIGFAFAEEFGEMGRDYFHRCSRFHSQYKYEECDKQYNQCLKSKGSGVTIKSFFYNAKNAGLTTSLQESKIDIPKNFVKKEILNTKVDDEVFDVQTNDKLPTIPKEIYPKLPEFLKKITEVATSNEEKDILLLGALVAMSVCFPKLYGIYDNRKIYPNLFLFITAQASAGKGKLVHCRQLVNQVHKKLREDAKTLKQQYEIELAQYNAEKGKSENREKPTRPPEKMLFIPANNSSTGAYQLLGDSDGRGLIFETEGDTLAQAFKSDYGNYSDGFRKAFHHETISYYRRTDREYVDIEKPCLSTVLSGTPKQITALIPDAENGLFSRFIFYQMNVNTIWKDVFGVAVEDGLDDYFQNLGYDFYNFYGMLLKQPEIQFSFTKDQQQAFNEFFAEAQNIYINIKGLDYMATVRRLGIITFRLGMLISVFRILETGEITNNLICEDEDFDSLMAITKTLVKHSAAVFENLPRETTIKKHKNKKEKFLDCLPKNFNRQKYLEVAKDFSINEKTAEGYITAFVKAGILHRESHDNYINTTNKEDKDIQEAEDI